MADSDTYTALPLPRSKPRYLKLDVDAINRGLEAESRWWSEVFGKPVLVDFWGRFFDAETKALIC
jgi:hypothetical protein